MRPIILACSLIPTLIAARASADDAIAKEPPSTCSAPQIERAKARGEKSLVRVESPDGAGHGFIYLSPEHVATTFALVKTGRGIEVVLPNGNRRDAVVVSYDETRNLAILKLDRPASAPPLRLSQDAPAVGDPVLALGVGGTFDEPATQIDQGIVTKQADTGFASDALVSSAYSWGGPLFDCEGKVIGVSNGDWSDHAIAAPHLAAVAREMADDAVYDGDWSLLHPSASMVIQIDNGPATGYASPNAWLGFSAGTALIGHDELFFPLRASVLGLVGPQPDDQELETRTGWRVQGETGVGYRAMLVGGAFPLYLVPKLGVAMAYDEITSATTHELVDLDHCRGSRCNVEYEVDEHTTSTFHVMPTLGLGFGFGFGEVGYQFQLDVEDVSRSTHQITTGFQF